MEVDLAAMFLLGLLGTGHCVGMCGPIVLALPGGRRVGDQLTYHAGRIATYTAIGALLAAVGGDLGRLARIQVVMSLVAAAFLLGFGLSRLGVWSEPTWMQGLEPGRLPGMRRVLRGLRAGRRGALLPFGLLMGLLPCGLSFAAFARALAAEGAGAGALLVLAFGLGTLPGLLVFGTAASSFARRHRAGFDLLAAVVMIGLAAQLAVAGVQALAG